VTESLEDLTDEQLEQLLLDATAEGVPGRTAMARVTAIRTVLKRRARRATAGAEADAARALELVNACRPRDRQVTEVHPVWVRSILAEPAWAQVYVSDEEMEEMAVR